MKRIILSFASFAIFCSLFSQEFKIIDTSGNFLNNDTFVVNGLVTDYQIIAYLWVINTDTQTFIVKAKKDTIYTVNGSVNDFCWGGLCYPSTTFISTKTDTITPGDTSKEFSAHYKPFGNIGNTLIKYIFFSSHPNADDTVYVLYKVDSAQNINNYSLYNNFISSLIPNPANTYTSFSYSLKKYQDAKIIIYNILGNQIQSLPLTELSGKLTVNTGEFSPGIYFCALLADDKAVVTRKLIISR